MGCGPGAGAGPAAPPEADLVSSPEVVPTLSWGLWAAGSAHLGLGTPDRMIHGGDCPVHWEKIALLRTSALKDSRVGKGDTDVP